MSSAGNASSPQNHNEHDPSFSPSTPVTPFTHVDAEMAENASIQSRMTPHADSPRISVTDTSGGESHPLTINTSPVWKQQPSKQMASTVPPPKLSSPTPSLPASATPTPGNNSSTVRRKYLTRGFSSRYSFTSLTSSRFQTVIDLKYQNRAFFLISSKFKLRRFSIYITENPWFGRLILFCIFINCVFLSLYDAVDPDSVRNQILSVSEFVFQGIFTVEMCIKIFAQGLLFHKHAYLRDYWNLLDALIVTTGFLGFLELGSNFSILRAIRLLRPLRAISSLKEMRVVIDALFKSLPMLINAVVLYFFFLLLYGIIGVQLFKGKTRYRCYNDLTMALWDDAYLCGESGGNSCPDGYSCLPRHDNLNYGYSSFDNVFWSILLLFGNSTGENWSFTMYDLSETMTKIVPDLYMITFMLIGAFFIVNLNLVIISENFSSQLHAQREKQRRIREEERLLAEEESERMRDLQAASFRSLKRRPSSPELKYKVQTIYNSPSSPSKKTATESPVRDLENIPLSELSVERSMQQRLQLLRRRIFSLRIILEKISDSYDAAASCFQAVPYQEKIRSLVHLFVTSRIFIAFFTFLTILNTVALGIDHYMMEQWLEDALQISNYVFIGFFSVEVVLKFYGLGPKRFIQDGFNMLDLFIVVLSLLELVLGSSSGFTVLRTFRLLRILKLARFSENLQKLLRVILKSVKSAFMITILLAIVIFIYALLGMQLFGGTYGPQNDWPDQEKPRLNWDRFDLALISTFVVVSSEGWVLIQYEAMHATNPMAFLYFCSLFIVGNYVVINLFVALLLSQFKNDEEESVLGSSNAKVSFSFKDSALGILLFWKQRVREIPQEVEIDFVNQVTDHQLKEAANHDIEQLEKIQKPVHEANEQITVTKSDLRHIRKRRKAHRNFFVNRLVGDYSLFILGNNWFRRILRKIVTHAIFEAVILFLIFASVVTLVLEDPLAPPDAPLMRVLNWINLSLTCMFTIECMLKIVSMGLLFMKGAYLRDPWNILDLTIVVVSLLGQIFSSGDLQIFQTMRLLRTLRPLRFVNRLKGLKLVVDSLISSIPSILTVAVLCVIVYIIFGIMGVQLLAGTFYECSSDEWSSQVLCEQHGYEWRTKTIYNFDNLPNAMLTLFTMVTFENWPDVLMNGVDATEPGWVSVRNNHTYISIYFISFIIVGSFFISNLFVGVLIDQYYSMKNKKHIGLLSSRQKQWADVQRVLFDAKPERRVLPPTLTNCLYSKDGKRVWVPFFRWRVPVPRFLFQWIVRPYTLFRYVIFRIVTHALFELFILIVITLNVVAMALDHYQIASGFSLALTISNYVWTFIFVVEAILKLIGLGPVQYFRDVWNCFDFFITITGALGVVASLAIPNVPGFLSVFRLLRVFRLVRLIRSAKGLRQLLYSLVLSLPSLFNVGCLLALLYFIYALIGMRLFSRVHYSSYVKPEDDVGITPQAHFRDPWTAIVTMIRISGGEDWPNILEEAMVGPPQCSHKIGDCGNYYLAVVFFCSFVLFSSFIMINLFTAVILENFASVISKDGSVLNEDTVKHFQKCWKRFDPELTLYIHANDLVALVVELGEPLGFDSQKPGYKKQMRNLMRALSDMNHHDGNMLHYQEVLIRLAQYKFGVELPLKLRERFDSVWNRKIPQSEKQPEYTIQQIYAAMKLQQIWRKRVMERKLAEKAAQGPLFSGEPGDDDERTFENDSAFSNLESFCDEVYDPEVYHDSVPSTESEMDSLLDIDIHVESIEGVGSLGGAVTSQVEENPVIHPHSVESSRAQRQAETGVSSEV